jgi:hypothetical protein
MPYLRRNNSAIGRLVPGGTPVSAASAASFAFASSAASRTACPIWNVEREPKVPMSYGVTSVSGMTTRTASASSPRVSAAICAIAVVEPWPISTVPQ